MPEANMNRLSNLDKLFRKHEPNQTIIIIVEAINQSIKEAGDTGNPLDRNAAAAEVSQLFSEIRQYLLEAEIPNLDPDEYLAMLEQEYQKSQMI